MSKCLSADDVQTFLTGTLTDAEAALIESHLRGCTRCREVLDQLTDDPDLRQWAPARSGARRRRAEARVKRAKPWPRRSLQVSTTTETRAITWSS